ncbi:MAG: antitoxin VapB33 [Candidatus Binatia bacterium]|nr:MAG: antitoxin VapB33 [Candidatus Binatia bacterium]
MRTTLTLDEDVAAKLREVVRRTGVSFKEAVNSALRRGLASPHGSRARRKRYRVRVFTSPFRPGVDPLRLNQLSDDLELEETLAARRRHGRA